MRLPERPDDADNPLRLCYTGPSPERERQEEIEARFGLEEGDCVKLEGEALAAVDNGDGTATLGTGYVWVIVKQASPHAVLFDNTIFLNVDNLIGTPLTSCGAQMTAIFTPAQLPAAKAALKQPQMAPLSKSGRTGTP